MTSPAQVIGPTQWEFLHQLSYLYPVQASAEHQKAMLNFLIEMARVHPCGVCGTHMLAHMSLQPPKLAGREDMVEWTLAFHNAVSRRKKPAGVEWTRAQLDEHYLRQEDGRLKVRASTQQQTDDTMLQVAQEKAQELHAQLWKQHNIHTQRLRKTDENTLVLVGLVIVLSFMLLWVSARALVYRNRACGSRNNGS